MVNNFKRQQKNTLITNCTICRCGIFAPRDEFRANPDPKATGLCHSSCIEEASKESVKVS